MRLELIRYHRSTNQTTGILAVFDGHVHHYTCYSLELSWKDNSRNTSCVPIGTYKVKKRSSKKHGTHLHLVDVPDRSLILVHSGNFNHQIEGCILVGRMQTDLNKDGELDVAYSRLAMKDLLNFLPNEFELNITESSNLIRENEN